VKQLYNSSVSSFKLVGLGRHGGGRFRKELVDAASRLRGDGGRSGRGRCAEEPVEELARHGRQLLAVRRGHRLLYVRKGSVLEVAVRVGDGHIGEGGVHEAAVRVGRRRLSSRRRLDQSGGVDLSRLVVRLKSSRRLEESTRSNLLDLLESIATGSADGLIGKGGVLEVAVRVSSSRLDQRRGVDLSRLVVRASGRRLEESTRSNLLNLLEAVALGGDGLLHARKGGVLEVPVRVSSRRLDQLRGVDLRRLVVRASGRLKFKRYCLDKWVLRCSSIVLNGDLFNTTV